jgi:hypothetical protein
MSRRVAALIAVWLLAGCASPAEDRLTATLVVVADRDVQVADSSQRSKPGLGSTARSVVNAELTTPGPTAASTPVTAVEDIAADEVLRLLEFEDLFVLDLRTGITNFDDATAVVELEVVHGTGRGHPTAATYRIELLLEDGDWTVASLVDVP